MPRINDQCYQGMTQDGRMILTPSFAASIARHYTALGQEVPVICTTPIPCRAFDVAPARDGRGPARARDAAPPERAHRAQCLGRMRGLLNGMARAFDARQQRETMNSTLQAAADARREGRDFAAEDAARTRAYGVENMRIPTAAEQEQARARYKAQHGMMDSTPAATVDQYIELQAVMDARRRAWA
jgi:hypothetical protein